MTTSFHAGDSIVWTHRDNAGFATKRPVVFRALRGGGQAIVSFGADNHTVSLEDLDYPRPAERPYWVAPPIAVPAPPTPPTPPTEGELNECIAERRAAL